MDLNLSISASSRIYIRDNGSCTLVSGSHIDYVTPDNNVVFFGTLEDGLLLGAGEYIVRGEQKPCCAQMLSVEELIEVVEVPYDGPPIPTPATVVEGDNVTVEHDEDTNTYTVSADIPNSCDAPDIEFSDTLTILACGDDGLGKIPVPQVAGDSVTHDEGTNTYTINSVEFATHNEMDTGSPPEEKAVSHIKYHNEVRAWGASTPSGTDSVTIVGVDAGVDSPNVDARGLTAIGKSAASNGVGSWRVAVGAYAGVGSTGGSTVFIGTSAGRTVDGGHTIAIGSNTGRDSIKASYSVMIGTNAGRQSEQSGIYIGRNSGFKSIGPQNTAIGNNSGENNKGKRNTFLGSYAGAYNRGDDNIYVGSFTGPNKEDSNITIVGGLAHRSPGDEYTSLGSESGVWREQTISVSVSGPIITWNNHGVPVGDTILVHRTPTHNLGTVLLSLDANTLRRIYGDAIPSGSANINIPMDYDTNQTEVMMLGFQSERRVGESNYTVIGSPRHRNVYSTAQFEGAGFVTTSDERLKRKIKMLGKNSLGVEIWEFEFLNNGVKSVGWIAQQVEQLLVKKGYDQTTIDLAIPKSNGIDWKSSLDKVEKETGKVYNTWSDFYKAMKQSLKEFKNKDEGYLKIKEYEEYLSRGDEDETSPLDGMSEKEIEKLITSVYEKLDSMNVNRYKIYVSDIRGVNKTAATDLLSVV